MPPDPQLELHSSTELLLLEAEGGSSGPFNEDGTANVVIIRPGRAQGRGKRVYPREMLESQAGLFKGWPVFDNHESPAVTRARGGIPRSISELHGEIRESWWDPTFTHPDDDKRGFEPGAVLGKLSPTPVMRDLIESCPNVIKLSVRAFATGFRAGSYRGERAEIVEGFDRGAGGSVDAVTRDGAGGRVLALMESGYDQEHGAAERALAGIADDDLRHHLSEHRTSLLDSLTAHVPDPTPETTTQQAPLSVRELLESEEFSTAINARVDAQVQDRMQGERELIESRATARMERQIELRDLRDHARRLIEESKLPQAFREDLQERYALRESDTGEVVPSASLNVVAERDDDENVTKPAKKVLEESLSSDIDRERRKLSEANPTRVRGQGAGTSGDGGSQTTAPASRRGGFAAMMRKSGVNVPSRNGGEE